MPNSKSEYTRLRIGVGDLAPGHYRIDRHIEFGEGSFGWGFLVIRRMDGIVDVWDLIIDRDGEVAMPDLTWRRPGFRCQVFGPSEDFGNTPESATIQCWDKDLPDFWASELRWTLDGVSLGEYTPNMERVPGSLEGDDFVVRY